MTADEQRKLIIRHIALAALTEYLTRRADGTLGDMDIETLIMRYGQKHNVTADEAWAAVEESLIDTFHL